MIFPYPRNGAGAARHATRLLACMSLSIASAAVWAQGTDGGTFTDNTLRSEPARMTPGPDGQRRTPAAAAASGSGTTDRVRPSPAGLEPAAPMPQRRAAPPAPQSEFQRFVEASVGRALPIFGARFFADVADSFAPVDNVPVGADYVVAPGDEIVIRAWGSIDVDYRATVDRNGLVSLPRVGSFTVAGVKASALEGHLRAQIGRLFTNFNVNVTLGQLRGVKVFVVGPAMRPGVYNLASQATMLSAVVAAGGPAAQGSMRKIILRRDGRIVSELDVYEFLVQGDKSRDVQLAAGDVVVFQPAGPRVALAGSIEAAAIFELKAPQEPVRELLRYAGGASVLANRGRVQLERIDPSQAGAKRFVEDFRLDEGLQKSLRDGDLLSFMAISPEFANAVTLRGHVAQPVRAPWKQGMRVSDLIPDKEALITRDFYTRKNLLVQNIDTRDGEQRPVVTPASPGLFDELNWDYAVVERLTTSELRTRLIPFSLRRAVLNRDIDSNIELLPGDVVTVFSQRDVRVPVARQTRLVILEGEVATPGVYQLLPGETLRALIERAGGFTAQAYIYGLELSREETKARQRENIASATARLQALSATQSARTAANRRDDSTAASDAAVSTAAVQAQVARLSQIVPNGRIALELLPTASGLDALPDVPLENSDRIRVPPRTGFVTVAGAVVNNNAFLWKPGRTAGDYIKLAGLDQGAEVANMFILRADGTVKHATDNQEVFGIGNSLQSQLLYPGDAVIVPNQLDFETWGRAVVRNLKDWSQIFSQFGLGAAAIKSLSN